MKPYGIEYPLGHLGSAVSALSPPAPSPCAPSTPSLGQVLVRAYLLQIHSVCKAFFCIIMNPKHQYHCD